MIYLERETGIEPATFSLGSCIHIIESSSYIKMHTLKTYEFTQ